MSRDWTPREMYFADVEHFDEHGCYLHDMSIHMQVGEKKMEIGAKAHPSVYKKYPNLCFLFSSENMYHLSKMKGSNEVLPFIEEELQNILILQEKAPDSPVKKWFFGKLEPGYYMDENRDAFHRYIEEEIRKKRKE